MAKNVYEVDQFSGVVVTNQEFFTNAIKFSIRQGSSTKVRVTLAVSSNSVIEATLDDGVTWLKFNQGNNILAESIYDFDLPLRNGDLFNLRTTNPSGTTVRLCRLDQVTNEG